MARRGTWKIVAAAAVTGVGASCAYTYYNTGKIPWVSDIMGDSKKKVEGLPAEKKVAPPAPKPETPKPAAETPKPKPTEGKIEKPPGGKYPQGFVVVIAGAPASGKGTQCEFIKQEHGLFHLSTGDLLREHVRNGTEVGKRAKGFMDKGELVPDEVIIDLVKHKLNEPGVKQQGILLDGFPRTKEQANALKDNGIHVDLFVLMDVPDEMLLKRVEGRREDPVTKKIYNVTSNPPVDPEVTKRLIQRSDDTREAMTVRIKKYHENVASVRDNYTNMLCPVNGNRMALEVHGEIRKCLHPISERKQFK